MDSNLKHSLKVLAQNLGMPAESEREAREFINREIFKRLENNPNKDFPIGRCRILGSTGKRTGVWVTMDIDCVIFMNVAHPRNLSEYSRYITNIQKEWEKVLSVYPSLKRTARGMRLDFEGMEIELMVGFDTTGRTLDTYGNLEDQRAGVGKHITELPQEMARLEFSPKIQASLNEIPAAIVRSTSSVTHELIRLAKLWVYFTPPPQYYVCGKSYLVELLVLEAVKLAGRYNKHHDLMDCFKQFLQLLIDYENLEIGSGMNERSGTSIVDPSNQYNDLADGKNVLEFLEHCKGFARQTLVNICNIPPAPGEEAWFTWLKALYVKGSDRRHSVRSTLGSNRLLIIGPQDEVCFPQVVTWPRKDAGNRDVEKYEKLTRFICFNAAFIPKEKLSDFDGYVSCLRKCLQFTIYSQSTTEGGISCDTGRYCSPGEGDGVHWNFMLKYPVADGKAVHIWACLN